MSHDPLRRLVCVGGLFLLAGVVPAAAGPYLDYATGLAANPPDGAAYRPDLEEKLASLLNA